MLGKYVAEMICFAIFEDEENKKIFDLFTEWRKIEIGKNSAIHSGCYISGCNLKLGDASYINRNCLIDANHAQVIIGNNVGIGYASILLTICHDYSNADKRTGDVYGKSITVKDGVWVGGGVLICPGVTIEEGCVIAAGSVVTKNCEKNGVYGGNLAKLIKKLDTLQ